MGCSLLVAHCVNVVERVRSCNVAPEFRRRQPALPRTRRWRQHCAVTCKAVCVPSTGNAWHAVHGIQPFAFVHVSPVHQRAHHTLVKDAPRGQRVAPDACTQPPQVLHELQHGRKEHGMVRSRHGRTAGQWRQQRHVRRSRTPCTRGHRLHWQLQQRSPA